MHKILVLFILLQAIWPSTASLVDVASSLPLSEQQNLLTLSTVFSNHDKSLDNTESGLASITFKTRIDWDQVKQLTVSDSTRLPSSAKQDVLFILELLQGASDDMLLQSLGGFRVYKSNIPLLGVFIE
jgi:hypothetical protein